MTINATKNDLTVSATDHPAHHNELATAVNELVTPTAAQSMNGQRIANMGDPTAPQDAATKSYTDALAAGLAWKDAVRVATTANGALATAYENGDTVNGVVLVTGDRILLKNQTAPAENGIYTVNASGAPTRSTDADSQADLIGAAVFVSLGTTGAASTWVMTTPAPIVVGTTGITWAQFGSAVVSSPTTTRGDIIKRGASVDERLGIGTRGQALRATDIGSAVFEPRWRDQPWFDVTDYGATGDGTTNDYAAILAAYTALPATGGTLYFPPNKTYVIGTQLTISKPDVTLLGGGWSSVIKAQNSAALTNVIKTSTGATDCVIRDLKIDGNRANTGTSMTGDGVGIGVEESRMLIEHCEITGAALYGIILSASTASYENCVVTRCWIHDNGKTATGGYTSGSGIKSWHQSTFRYNHVAVTLNRIEHNYATFGGSHPAGSAIALDSAYVLIEGNEIIDNFNEGGQIVTSFSPTNLRGYWRIVGNRIEATTSTPAATSGIEITGRSISVVGNQITGTGANGAYVESLSDGPSGDIEIVGNGFRGHSNSVLLISTGACDNVIIAGNQMSASSSYSVLSNHAGNTNIAIVGNVFAADITEPIRDTGVTVPSLKWGNVGNGITNYLPSGALFASTNNDNIQFRYGTTGPTITAAMTSDRTLSVSKGAGAVGSANESFLFATIGGLDSITPFWSGFQWGGHTVTEGGSSRFPRLTLYTRSALGADPTDYEAVLALGNIGTLPGRIAFAAPAINGSRHRFGFGDGAISVNGLTLAYNGSVVAATFTDSVKSTGAGGIGYDTGAGGTVTQITSKSTGVTLNKACGRITMQAAALAAGAKVAFTVTNSTVAAADAVIVYVASGGTANAYRADVTAVAAGSFAVTVENITAGSLSEAPVIGFALIKAVTS